jgi:(S)-sulfolactate dehydrogenase
MTIAAHDPYLDPASSLWRGVERMAFGELIASADVISLHVPLTPETRRLIDAAAIARMKKSAILINAARGGVVDEAALASALRAGTIAGAALDVFEEEPLSAAAGAKLAGIPSLVLTPHIAGVTAESNVRVTRLTLENVRDALRKRRR